MKVITTIMTVVVFASVFEQAGENGEDITFSMIAITRGDYENLQITYRKYGYDKLVKVMCYCNPIIKKYIGYLDVSKYESEEEKKTATIDAFYFVYNRN